MVLVLTLARTTFFGRAREKERLAELVRRVPLVTLTGVGGAGKTRLAAEVAAERRERGLLVRARRR